jgi:tetratricopeptide (TPR) repeat protein
MYQEALGMIRLTLGATHSEAADPLHATGLVYHQLGNYEKALEHVAAALQIVEREVETKLTMDFGFSSLLHSLERTTTRWGCF